MGQWTGGIAYTIGIAVVLINFVSSDPMLIRISSGRDASVSRTRKVVGMVVETVGEIDPITKKPLKSMVRPDGGEATWVIPPHLIHRNHNDKFPPLSQQEREREEKKKQNTKHTAKIMLPLENL
jgi:hypothetical protein